MSEPPAETELAVLVADLIVAAYGVPRTDVTADSRIGDFGVDSVFAGAVLDAVERRTGDEIEFRAVADNWAELTVAGLAAQLRAGVPAPSHGAARGTEA